MISVWTAILLVFLFLCAVWWAMGMAAEGIRDRREQRREAESILRQSMCSHPYAPELDELGGDRWPM